MLYFSVPLNILIKYATIEVKMWRENTLSYCTSRVELSEANLASSRLYRCGLITRLVQVFQNFWCLNVCDTFFYLTTESVDKNTNSEISREEKMLGTTTVDNIYVGIIKHIKASVLCRFF